MGDGASVESASLQISMMALPHVRRRRAVKGIFDYLDANRHSADSMMQYCTCIPKPNCLLGFSVGTKDS